VERISARRAPHSFGSTSSIPLAGDSALIRRFPPFAGVSTDSSSTFRKTRPMGPRELIHRLTVHSPSYYLGRFQTVRRTVSALAGAKSRLRGIQLAATGDVSASPFAHLDPLVAVAQLKRDAYAPGFDLPADMVSEIATFARTATCNAPKISGEFVYGDIVGGKHPSGTSVAMAYLNSPADCPAIARLKDDPVLAAVVQRYLGFLPERKDVRLYWSFAGDISSETRRTLFQTIDYHFDVHDYNFCYAHFYITDTDRGSGAHVLVRGSHRRKPFSWLLGSARKSDAQIASYYDPQDILLVEAPGGYGFLEDTSCYHKALAPVERDRLLLQISYH
jgi:hypothetical protein